jgi:hypothetical protein
VEGVLTNPKSAGYYANPSVSYYSAAQRRGWEDAYSLLLGQITRGSENNNDSVLLELHVPVAASWVSFMGTKKKVGRLGCGFGGRAALEAPAKSGELGNAYEA